MAYKIEPTTIGDVLKGKFKTECPAYFRKNVGVSNWLQWERIKSLMPLNWPERFDRLHEWASKGLGRHNALIEKALRAWDEMGQK